MILPKSFASALAVIRGFKPDVVVGAGGYVSGPVVMMAALTRRPTLVMDSNALPGWTNRVLARFVDRAAVSFDQALPFFRGKELSQGIPFGESFLRYHRSNASRESFRCWCLAVHRGARAINEAIVAALPQLKESMVRLQIKHQTGAADFEKVEAAYKARDGMATLKYAATLTTWSKTLLAPISVVCRAGATTTAELIAAGKAAVMIPFPLAADDHQRKNAEALVESGAARMILQKDLSGERIAKEIIELAQHPEMVNLDGRCD